MFRTDVNVDMKNDEKIQMRVANINYGTKISVGNDESSVMLTLSHDQTDDLIQRLLEVKKHRM